MACSHIKEEGLANLVGAVSGQEQFPGYKCLVQGEKSMVATFCTHHQYPTSDP